MDELFFPPKIVKVTLKFQKEQLRLTPHKKKVILPDPTECPSE
jgi:hypothetical protein